jgi:hypothetical protein
MMDDKFVKEIAALAKTEMFQDGNVSLFSRQVFRAPLPQEPLADALEVSSLEAVVAYVRDVGPYEVKEGVSPSPIVHVQSPLQVSVFTRISGELRKRETLIRASCGFQAFKFDVYHPHQQFMVALQSLFLPTQARAELARILGTIKEASDKTSMDDGVTQKVTASTGVTLVTEVKLPNPVRLTPYRTFAEVGQPEGEFVLRVKSVGAGALPEVALFDADGGRWKLAAVDAIKTYIADRLPGTVVIG